MKRNASLVLMELVIMLLVFSLAAALCLQAFLWADSQSRKSSSEDSALIRIQNAAEVLKHHGGDFALAAQDCGGRFDGACWIISYDESWNLTDREPVYQLRAEPEPGETAYLGQAKLAVRDPEGAVLAELTVCWQEVAP